MENTYNLDEINNIKGKGVFFDANVLIYIFWTPGVYKWEYNYANAFGKLFRQGNDLFIDFTVVSEVINRTHKIDFEKFLKENKKSKEKYTYKQFRNSSEGKERLKDIYTVFKNIILDRFKVIGKKYSSSNIESFLEIDSLDFNDKAIHSLCKEKSLILFTNDADFKYCNIDILSSNPQLLKH